MQPTITKVNPREGTVTVKMEDRDGREVEKTFQLTEDVEYLDSTGQMATLDVFQSGDEVLIIETEGKIKEMKQHPETKKAGDKGKAQSTQKPGAHKPGIQKHEAHKPDVPKHQAPKHEKHEASKHEAHKPSEQKAQH